MIEFSIIQKISIYALPVLLAIILHEVAHGWVALRYGDQTAKLAGRLTLNPLPHIDILGTVILPLIMVALGGFIFGWAKPVPVDSRNMRNPRWNMVVVAAAGPIANIIMAIFWALIMRFSTGLDRWFGLPLNLMGQAGVIVNIMLAVLNLLPLPPLDGGRMACNLLPGKWGWQLAKVEPYGFLILISLLAIGALSYIMLPFVRVLFYFVMSLTGNFS